jgi:hypothetical protein
MKSNVLAIVFNSSLGAEQKVELAMQINLIDSPDEFASGSISAISGDGGVPTQLISGVGPQFIGRYCIIRTYSAGVHCGEVADRVGTEVILKNCRRIHYWNDAFTLNEIALNGAGGQSRLSVAVPEILLTEAIEILPCTPEATQWLSSREAHSND